MFALYQRLFFLPFLCRSRLSSTPKAENARYSFSPASDAQFQTMRSEGKLAGMEIPFPVFRPSVMMGRGIRSRGEPQAEV